MAAGGGNPVKAIAYAFLANLAIAIAKTVAAIFTGSSSMTAEAIHSYADTGNQVLLLLGMKRAQKPADREHPLGYGKLSYFWSFIVALLLFSLGGLYSLYEGYHKLGHTEPVQSLWIALVVLGLSIGLEAFSMWGCMKEVNKVRGKRTLWQWLKESRNSELVVVFGEDLAALLGLVMAFVFLSIAGITGNGIWDAIGSMCIGTVLLVIALFVADRIKKLLIGRSADPELHDAVEEMIRDDDGVLNVFNVITVQMGPKVMLAAKIQLEEGMPIEVACEKINRVEQELKRRFPEIGWCFVEPDVRE